MIYLIAGMNRSGSTWVYNVVRLLLSRAGAPELACGWVDNKDALLTHQTPVIKVHIFDAALLRAPFTILTSHRDLRDVTASMARKFPRVPVSIDTTRFIFEQYQSWVDAGGAYDMKYEAMIADPVGEATRIARAIGLSHPGIDVEGVVAEMEAQTRKSSLSSTTGFDRETLLHRGHVTDGRPGSWHKDIPAELAGQIEREFAGWMRERGYV